MSEPKEWTEADIVSLVDERAEESFTYEFKACGALLNKRWREELAKDVSAFANSAGGTIIYGIKEDPVTHEASEIDEGFDPKKLNKETIQRVIDSHIHRRISGIKYHVVDLAKTRPGKILFVLEIPESSLAPHMANHKFYRRLEFESKPMEEYEIRERYRRETFPGKDVVESWRDDAINPLISTLESEKNLLSSKEWTWHRSTRVFNGFRELCDEPASANRDDFLTRQPEVLELMKRHDAAVAVMHKEGKTLYGTFARSPILKEIFDRTTSEESLLQLKRENPNSFRGSSASELFEELFGRGWNEQQRLESFAQWAINSNADTTNFESMLVFWRTNGPRFIDCLTNTDQYERVLLARQSVKDAIDSLIALLKLIRKDLSEQHNIPHEAKQQVVNVNNDPFRL